MSDSKHEEGDVVTTVNKSKLQDSGMISGTLVMITNSLALVLDKDGLIHNVSLHEVYKYQDLGDTNASS